LVRPLLDQRCHEPVERRSVVRDRSAKDGSPCARSAKRP
jgi:hypothetical protein